MENKYVKYIDTSEEVKAEMINLSKKALKEGGKVVTKILRNTVPVRTGGLKKSITAWAKIDKVTGHPYLEVGYRSRSQMKKRGVHFFVNPSWFEFGTAPHEIKSSWIKGTFRNGLTDGVHKFGKIVKHPGMTQRNFLRNTVYNNINEIKSAEEKHLGELTDLMVKQGYTSLNYKDEEV